MPRLGVVVTSTRPGRVGLPIAHWFVEAVKKHGRFTPELVDLLEVGLPVFNEPKHPRLGQYEHEHTKAWSQTVRGLDAFVFVIPEYNFAMPPALLNAFDYLASEWAYKACAFVNYGGVSAGTRSANMVRQIAPVLKMMPLPDAVNIPSVSERVKDGVLTPLESMEKAAVLVLDELFKWDSALRVLR